MGDETSDAPQEHPEQTPEVTHEILAVMANPWRMRAYDMLLIYGDMTTRRLAARTDIAEASLNRHMVELNRIRFVRAVNEGAPVRQLIWHAVPGGVRGVQGNSREVDAWVAATHESQNQSLSRWLAVSESWPQEWREATTRWDYVLPGMTLEEMWALNQELEALGARWLDRLKQRQREGNVPEDAVTTYLVTHLIPYPVDYDDNK